jgi:hypothetical protein
MKKRAFGLASAAVVAACADGPVSPATEAATSTPPAAEADSVRTREITLSLVGRGTTTEWRTETPTGAEITVTTEIEAATRELVVGEPVDTLLAMSFAGLPALGSLTMTPPAVNIQEVAPGIPIIFFEGSPTRLELAVFVRQSGFPARQFVQVEPATLEVSEYVASEARGATGLLKGLITFTAEEYYREWAHDGAITMRKSPGQVRVTAHVAVQMGHRVRNAEPVPGH